MSEEVGETDWDDVMAVLKVLIEDVNNASSELCELKSFDMVRGLQNNVLKDLKAMYSYADKKLHAGEFETGELEFDEDLPPRGTGLEMGTAEGRRAGVPRTEEERRLRHTELYGEEEELF
ncbi:hypothetical protein KAX02_03630 [candidate division WOR-3 bacterium]|nr:hypothetical protein [candidate division WOR-3 bacterium]